MINQTIAKQMLIEFQQFGVTVSENLFFGIPFSEYFAAPKPSGTSSPALQQPWTTDRQQARQTIANFATLNLIHTEPTFFGVPVEAYFGRTEAGVWEQILHDITPVASAQ